ncbi:MAG: hypothetical protein QXR89_06980 [Candidatus Bathyarchaeia archaeon]
MISSILLTLAFSSVSMQQIVRNDPWLDYDDNGEISMTDTVMAVSAFSTRGNSTKNVKIIHTTYMYGERFHVALPGGVPSVWRCFNVEGYERITIALDVGGNASIGIGWSVPNGGF